MKRWNLEAVKTYLIKYELRSELSGVYVFYSERNIQVEFVENNNRGMDKISQSSVLKIIDKLPDEAITNVIDLTNGRMKLTNELLITELNYNYDFDFEDLEIEEVKLASYDLAKKFDPFDNLYYKKIEMKKDFVDRYKLKDISVLDYEIDKINNTGSKCKIFKIKQGE